LIFAFARSGLSPITNAVPETAASQINASTRLCAVYGHPIAHSASPAMHNAAMRALGLNWRYVAFDVQPENLRAAIEGARAMRFAGLNLTVPHKLLAINMLDDLDTSAHVWGAVNTIRFESQLNGLWTPIDQCPPENSAPIRAVGFNTDADAVIRAIREDLALELRGTRVLLLGAGGAGRVAALKLAAEGVDRLFLVNRTASKAEAIAREIQERYPSAQPVIGYPGSQTVDLVLNATSLGLKTDDPLPWDDSRFAIRQAGAAFDMIYRPAETPFLRAARQAGVRTANGLGMLLHQGAAALELWTGRKAPLDIMRRALQEAIYG
jgi:shikimate dehydrogenase